MTAVRAMFMSLFHASIVCHNGGYLSNGLERNRVVLSED